MPEVELRKKLTVVEEISTRAGPLRPILSAGPRRSQ